MENVKTKKRIFDIVLDIFVWLSFFVAVALAITAFFSTVSGTENGRSFFGHKLLIVNTDSMSRPETGIDDDIFFTSGDLIIIKEIKDSSVIAVGDVITFVSADPDNYGKTVSHKVRSVKRNADGTPTGFETYGIKTGASDETLVKPDAIIGRYVGKVPCLGSLFNFFKKPAGYFATILIPCLLLIIFFSVKVGKLITKKEMTGIFDIEIRSLKDRISEMEREGISVEIKDAIESAPSDNANAETGQDIKCSNLSESQQVLAYTERVIESTLKTLGNTIETLTSTIESLALTAEKPVETLSHAVETLAATSVRPEVTENKDEELTEIEETEEEEEVDDQSAKDFDESSNNELQMREKMPFSQRLFDLDSDVRNYFSDIHNEIVSYKRVKYRISYKGITYRVGRHTIASMSISEDTLKLCIGLGIKNNPKAVVLQGDHAGMKLYRDALLTVDVKSVSGRNNAIRLVKYVAKNNGFRKDLRFKNENVFRQIKLFK